jgi:hypothetical protein
LDDVRQDAAASLYPGDRLSGLRSALMGFCAAFHGAQDCVWVADAGLPAVTAVDIDERRLSEMSAIYPATWGFIASDLFIFAAGRYAEDASYDLVSLDPPSDLFQTVADLTGLWCGLADRLVVIGTGRHTLLEPPPGWDETDRITRSTRTGGVYWSVLEPDDARNSPEIRPK